MPPHGHRSAQRRQDGPLLLRGTGLRTALYWSSGGWKSGSNSRTTPFRRPWRISSYEVLDRLLTRTADRARFPRLRRIVVAGHSAGGQFTNRYAAGTRLTAAETPGIARRFVVANPSSYLYFDARRFHRGGLRTLTRAEVSACPGDDDYKYGLADRNRFMAALDAAAVRRRYATSDVTYLLGARDTSTTMPSLDKGCEARWQGASRLERGMRYYDYLGAAFGPLIYRRHHRVVVPGVGHDGRAVIVSRAGQAALFG